MRTIPAFLAVALACQLVAAKPAAAAETQEPSAVLQVMAYGYKVKVLVNGVDTGIQGGKSEGRRLFSRTDPMFAKATPEIRARHFVLQRGANEVTIEYAKLDAKTDDTLEITIDAANYPQPLLRVVNKSRASDKVSVKLAIEPTAPPSFKPMVIGDVK